MKIFYVPIGNTSGRIRALEERVKKLEEELENYKSWEKVGVSVQEEKIYAKNCKEGQKEITSE